MSVDQSPANELDQPKRLPPRAAQPYPQASRTAVGGEFACKSGNVGGRIADTSVKTPKFGKMSVLPSVSMSAPARQALVGRMFVNAPVDYLLVGGGITLPIFLGLYFWPGLAPTNRTTLWVLFFAINASHFAASTVRLYTKPGARQELPFLSWVFPVICLAAVALGLYLPIIGQQLQALYLTWSPYHYAAQTYGLAVMYAMRSGARLDARDKSLMWWTCMLPFAFAFVVANTGGLFWFVSREAVMQSPLLAAAYTSLVQVLRVAILVLPVSIYWQLHHMRGKRVPMISLLMQVTNGVWWIGSDYLNAWLFTAMMHSVQYLIVISLRHADEQMSNTPAPQRWKSILVHGTAFYGFSLAVALGLFIAAPAAYTLLGFGAAESYAMMVFVINIHHFVVDGFIWKNKPASPATRPTLETATVSV